MGLRKNVFRYVPSLGEFVAQADRKPYHSSSGADWCGAPSYEAARDMCLHGWSDARPQADAIVNRVMGHVMQYVDMDNTPTLHLVGGAPNVPMLLAGVPNHMMMFTRTEQQVSKPVVRVLVDAGAEARVGSDKMLTRASAISALLEVLARMGHTMSIDLTSPVEDKGYEHNLLVTLHNAGDHFDMDALMFCLGHPAFHRYLWFSHRWQDGVGHGMGSTRPIPNSLSSGYDLVVSRTSHKKSNEPMATHDPEGWVMWALAELDLLG